MSFRIGLIGGGNITETHARAARGIPGVEIAAIYGTHAAKVAALCREHGGIPYDNFEAFLAHAPMDLVMIGSPSGLHAGQGIAAARRGLHVLTEKPIDTRAERADTLIAEAKASGVKLGVIFQDRAKPHIQRLKKALDEGALGKPILAVAQVKWFRSADYYEKSRWRGTLSLDGGGALMNQGVHTVDLLLWLWGDVTRVQARAAAKLHTIQSEDTLVANMEFENGALGTFVAATSAYPGYPRRLELTGSEGTVILERDRILRADLRVERADLSIAETLDENQSASSAAVTDIRGHEAVLADFLRAIETNGKPLCDGTEGRRSLAVVEAVYAAARSGQIANVG